MVQEEKKNNFYCDIFEENIFIYSGNIIVNNVKHHCTYIKN